MSVSIEKFKLKLLSVPWRLRKWIIIFLFATSLLCKWSLLKSILWKLLKLSKHWACQSFCSCHVFHISDSAHVLQTMATQFYWAVTLKTEYMASEIFLVPKEGLPNILKVITLFVHSYMVMISLFSQAIQLVIYCDTTLCYKVAIGKFCYWCICISWSL